MRSAFLTTFASRRLSRLPEPERDMPVKHISLMPKVVPAAKSKQSLISSISPTETLLAYSAHESVIRESDISSDFSDYGANYLDNKSRIPRTANFDNLFSFVDSKDTVVSDDAVPHVDDVQELRTQCARLYSPDEDLQLRFVDNALFMTFYQGEADRANKTHIRYWDDLDIEETLKSSYTLRKEGDEIA